MIKLKKSIFELVYEAKKEINNLIAKECFRLHPDKNNLLVNLRNIREIVRSDEVLRASNVLRGILKFCFYSKYTYHKEFFNKKFYFIFNYASFCRSALTIRAIKKIRFYICLISYMDILDA